MEFAEKKREMTQGARARTGLPVQMKRSFEARSGLCLDDVRVHYNSDRPARLGALAYTMGSQIFVGPGQERHLAHELGHVIQQKRGLVRPTGRLNGLPVNTDPALERAADGALSLSGGAPPMEAAPVVQRMVGFEFQTVGEHKNVYFRVNETDQWTPYGDHGDDLLDPRGGVRITADGSDVEYITAPVETPTQAEAQGNAAAAIHRELRERYGAGTREGMVIRRGGLFFRICSLGTTAHPQATVGVRLVAVPRLMEELARRRAQLCLGTGTVRRPAENELLRGITTNGFARSAATRADILDWQGQTLTTAIALADQALRAAWRELGRPGTQPTGPASEEIRALLAVMIAYNRQYSILFQHPGGGLNAKNAMPVMLRTSLYDIYHHAITREPHGSELFEHAYRKVQWVRRTTPRYGTPANVPTSDAVLVGEFRRVEDSDDYREMAVTVRQWHQNARAEGPDPIATNPDGFDSVSEVYTGPGGDLPAVQERFHLPGLVPPRRDALDIGLPGGAPGILAELRGLERNVEYTRWGTLARLVAEMVDLVNTPPPAPLPRLTVPNRPAVRPNRPTVQPNRPTVQPNRPTVQPKPLRVPPRAPVLPSPYSILPRIQQRPVRVAPSRPDQSHEGGHGARQGPHIVNLTLGPLDTRA